MLLNVDIDSLLKIYLRKFIGDVNNKHTREVITQTIGEMLKALTFYNKNYGTEVICNETNNTPFVVHDCKLIVDPWIFDNVANKVIYSKRIEIRPDDLSDQQ